MKHEAPVAPGATRVRFVVVGDAGVREPLPGGQAVMAKIASTCQLEACDFAVFLGDNLYERGFQAESDGEVFRSILDGYRVNGELPAYVVLGNHDWQPWLARHRVADRQLRWIGEQADVFGNAHYFDFEAGPIHLWALDTNHLVRRQRDTSNPTLLRWAATIDDSDATWKIALGHHPWRSNGNHGGAGEYRDKGLKIWPGKRFRDFLAAHILGRVDLYISGHDHDLQFYDDSRLPTKPSAATAIVGSAAKTRPRHKHASNVAQFEAYTYGFAIVDANHQQLSITFHYLNQGQWNSWRTTRTRTGSDYALSHLAHPDPVRASASQIDQEGVAKR